MTERERYIIRCALCYMLSNIDDLNECFDDGDDGDHIPFTEEEVDKLAMEHQ